MDGKPQGFPAEHQPNHHTASAGLPPAHSSSWWQNEATHMYPAIHIKENMIPQIRAPPTSAPCPSSQCHMPILGTFGSGQVSVCALWLI